MPLAEKRDDMSRYPAAESPPCSDVATRSRMVNARKERRPTFLVKAAAETSVRESVKPEARRVKR